MERELDEAMETDMHELSESEAEELLEELKEEEERLRQEHVTRLATLGRTLQRKASDQVSLKNTIEQRWLADLRQYNGQYEPAVLETIKQRKGSQVFGNITLHKANAAEARLADMLFPTDDKNWGILPTPVPTLNKARKTKAQGVDQQGQPVDLQAQAEATFQEALDKARLMETEIHDQLTECGYNSESRDMIHDSVVLGTGIIKGPVIEGRYKKTWTQQDDGQGGSVSILDIEQVKSACARRVPPWNFFPDMSATRTSECEFFFERHHFSKRELSDLAKLPGFMEDQIRELLDTEEVTRSSSANTYLSQMREINGFTSELNNDNRFEVWEYTGPIDKKDLEDAGFEIEEDALIQPTGTVWICEGKVLKVSINEMETGDMPYSVFCFQEDDTSVFGKGIPFLMNNAQSVYNSAYRMIMDNAGLSSGPQIVVNKALVEPADGDWTMTPKKIWTMKDKMRQVHEVFGSFDINSHQGELGAILQMASQLADEETSVPKIAQGEGGGQAHTASGMSMLMNSANIVLQRSVKVWDDNVTRPLIRRFYDWNMQFNDKEEIKGDYQVDARGSSVMMVRETQIQSMAGLMQMSQSEAFAPLTKFPALYRMALRQMQIPTSDIVKTDEELAQEQQAAQEQAPQQDPMVEIAAQRLQLDTQKEQFNQQFKQQELQIKQQASEVDQMRARLGYEETMAKIAAQKEMTLAQLEQAMGLKQMDLASAEKLMAFETQVKQAYGTGV